MLSDMATKREYIFCALGFTISSYSGLFLLLILHLVLRSSLPPDSLPLFVANEMPSEATVIIHIDQVNANAEERKKQ